MVFVAYLLTSLPAEMAEGTGYGSSTVTFLYPLRASQRAVDEPQVPQPTMRMLVEAGSVGLRSLEVIMSYADTFIRSMVGSRSGYRWEYDFPIYVRSRLQRSSRIWQKSRVDFLSRLSVYSGLAVSWALQEAAVEWLDGRSFLRHYCFTI